MCHVPCHLHAHQGIGLHAECLFKPDRHIGGQVGAAVQQGAQCLPRYPEMFGQILDLQPWGSTSSVLIQPPTLTARDGCISSAMIVLHLSTPY